MIRADQYIAEHGKGRWRRARKRLRCQHYWRYRTEGCAGTGFIEPGEQYFDTEELDGSAGGFGVYRCCAACAGQVIPESEAA
jgi:hypothetical protein